jgi:UV DNA damage endonuclease
MDKASELALNNCQDLIKILKWNLENNIYVFRISSDLFPRITDKFCGYKLDQLSTFNEIQNTLSEAGKFAYDNKMILSCHPGPYTVLGSQDDEVVKNSIKEIEYHALIGDMLKIYAPDLQFYINFHIGNKFSVESGDRFCKNFESLPYSIQEMIIIENDDKKSCWSISKLYENIHKKIGIPLTFDYHHSKFSREDDITDYEEFLLAKQTWGRDVYQETHFSSSENNNPKHSDYILDEIPEWMINDDKIYILLEAKAKELAVLKYCSCKHN